MICPGGNSCANWLKKCEHCTRNDFRDKKPVILDDNPLSIACYLEEYSDHFILSDSKEVKQ